MVFDHMVFFPLLWLWLERIFEGAEVVFHLFLHSVFSLCWTGNERCSRKFVSHLGDQEFDIRLTTDCAISAQIYQLCILLVLESWEASIRPRTCQIFITTTSR